jgi:hypothetical protein
MAFMGASDSYRSLFKPLALWLGILSLTLGWLMGALPVRAQELTNRSVNVSTAAASVRATHTFQFTYVSAGTLASVAFEYCSNSPIFGTACTPPAGLDVGTATLNSSSGNGGFGVDNIHTTVNKLVLTRIPAPVITGSSSYVIGNVMNPSAPNQTEFIRISTYASAAPGEPVTDNGSVAFATNPPFVVGAYVPPYLRLCTGITVATDCSWESGNSINLGTLTAKQANIAQSQFAAATNSPSGYVVFAVGTTMTSGNNVIPALNSPSIGAAGVNQFGINLRANSSPAIGSNPAGIGIGTPTAYYNTPNLFAFRPGDAIATSTMSTNYNKMTVSYLVNINNSQPIGVYSTTLTYVAIAQF